MMYDSANDSSDGVERLYEEHRRSILAYLARLIDDRETAEDLCQETFLKALRAWQQHGRAASPVAWLYRIATNTAYDHLRRCRRAHFVPLIEADLASGLYTPQAQADERAPVHAALAQLPARYRVPLLLQIYEGQSLYEIAAALGCSNDAVKMRLLRARERFRQVYQG